MATPRRSVPAAQVESIQTELPPVVLSEEMIAVGLFGEMVKRIDEIYVSALGLENTQQLAKLLGEVGVVKVTLQGIIGELKVEEEMRKNEEALMAQRAMEVENG